MPEPLVKEIKVSYKKSNSFWMAFGVILVLFSCDQLNVPFFQSLENKAIDFRFNVRGPRPPQAPIKLVTVDEKSLKEVGQWPWPRATHAKIIRLLKEAGAKVVFYDVFFPEPERTQEKMLTQLDGKTTRTESERLSARWRGRFWNLGPTLPPWPISS